MERPSRKPSTYADFFYEIGVLNNTPRSGFRFLGGVRQSISQHLFRTACIGYALAYLEQQRGESADIGKVLEDCLFHDIGEARAGDLDYVSQKYTQSDELRAVEDAARNLPFGRRIIEAFRETEERSTPEGVIARDADQLEMLCTLRELIEAGNKLAESWIPPLLKRLRTRSAQELAEEIINTNPEYWWYGDRKDQYWIDGGKNKQ